VADCVNCSALKRRSAITNEQGSGNRQGCCICYVPAASKGFPELREELKMVLKFDGMDLKRLLI
jgi:hypothetical protein